MKRQQAQKRKRRGGREAEVLAVSCSVSLCCLSTSRYLVRQRIHVHASVVEVSRISSGFLREGGPRIHRSSFPLWEMTSGMVTVFCSCGLVLQWIPVPASVYALFSFFLRATYIWQSLFSDCLARGVQENWMEMTVGVRRIRRSPLDRHVTPLAVCTLFLRLLVSPEQYKKCGYSGR